jgi:sugar phosphate isomerase/epimerase
VEVFATRSHFDYHDARAIAQLGEWLSDTGLELHSVHAPIVEAMRQGRWVGSWSIAASEEARRRAAIAEIEAALAVARQVPYRYLVVHVGMPTGMDPPPRDNQPDAARRSIEDIAGLAAAAGVQVALELIPNPLSDATTLVSMIENDLDGVDVGVCLDYGHANLIGDVGDAIEVLAGHLWTTHVHDNRGQRDDHLVPYAGAIDWDAAIMSTQKVGYDGMLMFEVADTGDPVDVLARAAKARERMEKAFIT